MPRENISEDALEGVMQESTGKIYLVLMTIEQDDMPVNPLRLVNNSEDIVSRGNTYKGIGFRFIFPGDGSIEQPRGQLEVDNTDQSITDALDSISTPAEVTVEVVLYNPNGESDDVVQSISGLKSRTFTNDLVSLRAPLLFDDTFGQRIPADVYDPTQNPGLF